MTENVHDDHEPEHKSHHERQHEHEQYYEPEHESHHERHYEPEEHEGHHYGIEHDLRFEPGHVRDYEPMDEREHEFEHSDEVDHHESHHMTEEEQEVLAEQLSLELAKRHLGHKVVKQPIWTQTSISDIEDSRVHTVGMTQVTENIYDDLSADRTYYTTSTDQITESTIGFLPDEDGILKTFIDRYTTMLIHDSVYMEELPAPHFMHQSFSMLHPSLQYGDMEHDPRDYHDDEDEHNDFAAVLKEHDQAEHHRRSESQPSTAQLLKQHQDTYDVDNYYHERGLPLEEGYHNERTHYDHHAPDEEHRRHQYSNEATLQHAVAKEGASQLGTRLGMHFRQPEELQIREREVESAHRHSHHPLTRYEPDDFRPHHKEGETEVQRLEAEHGLPVHDRYGHRAMEHDPFHQEYVHGTNYELKGVHRGAPVIEHNSHAFPTKGAKAEQKPLHKGDAKKIPAPKEAVPK